MNLRLVGVAILLIVLVLSCESSKSVTTDAPLSFENKLYVDGLSGGAQTIVSLKDGGFITVAPTYRQGFSGSVIVKFDRFGNNVWTRGAGWGARVIEAGGHYLIFSNRVNEGDMKVEHVDKGGLVVDTMITQFGTDWFSLGDVVLTKDNTHLVFFGSINGSGLNWTDLLMVRTNLSMAVEKKDTLNLFGNIFEEYVRQAIITSDDEIFVCGEGSYQADDGHELIFKINTNGQLAWSRTEDQHSYGGAVSSIEKIGDTLLALQNYGQRLSAFTASGDSVGAFTATPSTCMVVSEDKRLILAGNESWEVRDLAGNIIESISTPGYQYRDVINSADGGLVFCGNRISNDTTYLFIKKEPL